MKPAQDVPIVASLAHVHGLHRGFCGWLTVYTNGFMGRSVYTNNFVWCSAYTNGFVESSVYTNGFVGGSVTQTVLWVDSLHGQICGTIFNFTQRFVGWRHPKVIWCWSLCKRGYMLHSVRPLHIVWVQGTLVGHFTKLRQMSFVGCWNPNPWLVLWGGENRPIKPKKPHKGMSYS